MFPTNLANKIITILADKIVMVINNQSDFNCNIKIYNV